MFMVMCLPKVIISLLSRGLAFKIRCAFIGLTQDHPRVGLCGDACPPGWSPDLRQVALSEGVVHLLRFTRCAVRGRGRFMPP